MLSFFKKIFNKKKSVIKSKKCLAIIFLGIYGLLMAILITKTKNMAYFPTIVDLFFDVFQLIICNSIMFSGLYWIIKNITMQKKENKEEKIYNERKNHEVSENDNKKMEILVNQIEERKIEESVSHH